MKNILFICTEGFDTPGPSNHLISSLIEDVLDSKFKVSLIQSRRKRINAEIPTNLLNKKNLDVYTIDRKVISKNSFIKRYLEEVFYCFKSFKVWKSIKEVDLVFVQSSPTAVFSIILLKIFLKKPIVYSVQDMWPGSAINSGVLSNKMISKFFIELQKLAYKNSDALTVISEDMKVKIIEQGVESNKVHTIVNWFDDRTIHEVKWEDNRFVEKYNLNKKKFYVQYAGTMGYVFDYKMVLEVAERLQKYEDIEFQMIGDGSQKKAFMEKSTNLKNIHFYPLEPQEMVSEVYSACSISLIPLKKGIIGNSVPSKAGLLMACKRTVINSVDVQSEYYTMFNENEIGVSVSNESPDQVALEILNLYNNNIKRKHFAENGYIYGKKYYARSQNTKKFINLFSQLIKK